MASMTDKEAILALKGGRRMTHHRFAAGEWIEAVDETAQTLRDEDGNIFPAAGFWVIRKGKDWGHGWYELQRP